MTNVVDITNIVEIVIALIVAVASYFVIPYIKSKLTASQWSNLQDWAEVGVKAAEAIFIGTKLGKDKREYVMKYLANLCKQNGYKFDEDIIRVALENAWEDMTGGSKGDDIPVVEFKAEGSM